MLLLYWTDKETEIQKSEVVYLSYNSRLLVLRPISSSQPTLSRTLISCLSPPPPVNMSPVVLMHIWFVSSLGLWIHLFKPLYDICFHLSSNYLGVEWYMFNFLRNVHIFPSQLAAHLRSQEHCMRAPNFSHFSPTLGLVF